MSVPGKREQMGNAGRHSQDGLYLVIGTMCVLTLTRVGISSRRPPPRTWDAPPTPPPRPKRRRSPLGHAEAAPPAEPATASVGRSKAHAEWSGAACQDCSNVAGTPGARITQLTRRPASASYNPNCTFWAWAASFTIW